MSAHVVSIFCNASPLTNASTKIHTCLRISYTMVILKSYLRSTVLCSLSSARLIDFELQNVSLFVISTWIDLQLDHVHLLILSLQ